MTASGIRFGLPDLNDGKPWSEMDGEVENGSTLEEAAGHLCRSGTKEEVAKKAEELGLHSKRASVL